MDKGSKLLNQEWRWQETAGLLASQVILAGIAVVLISRVSPGGEAASLEGSVLTIAAQIVWLIRSRHHQNSGGIQAPEMLAAMYRAELEKIIVSVSGLLILFSIHKGKSALAVLFGYIVPQGGMWLFWAVVQLRRMMGNLR